ncbi:ABC transporter substrate-binding protein [Cupriavidus basilensis]
MPHDLKHAAGAAARIATRAAGVLSCAARPPQRSRSPRACRCRHRRKPRAAGAPPIKVAFIDQLSGPLANVGQIFQANLKFALDDANAQGGVLGRNYELLSYDNKLSPQESLDGAAKRDRCRRPRGIHRRLRLSGGNRAGGGRQPEQRAQPHAAHPDHQLRLARSRPDGRALQLLAFRHRGQHGDEDACAGQFAREQKGMHKVYLLNQDYTQGRIWAALGRQMIAGARPDVQFVGEALHPLARVKDFAPYVSRIKESGADTVVTGNWGQDLSLLIKAAGDAGYELNYLNHSGGGAPGTVLAVSQAKNAHLTWVAEYLPNSDDPVLAALAARVKQTPAGEYFAPRVLISVQMLSEAIRRAKSDEPTSVAFALEGMQYQSPVGDVLMRKGDHQLLLPQVVSTIAPVDGKSVKVGVEGTQYGFRLDGMTAGRDLNLPSACRMKRPAGV